MKRIVITAALVAASFGQPALALAPAEDRTEVVRYGDLDLTRASDVRKLDRRIGQAVREVCGTASSADVEGGNEVRRCRIATRESLADVRRQAIAAAARPAQLASADER